MHEVERASLIEGGTWKGFERFTVAQNLLDKNIKNTLPYLIPYFFLPTFNFYIL
jgi:hypothetical protein